MPTRIEARTIEDGTTAVEFKEIPAEELRKLNNMAEGVEAEKSAARKRLEKLRAQRGAVIEPLTIGGEEWFVKRLNWPQLVEVNLLVSRLGLAPSQPGGAEARIRNNLIAILASCVVSDASGEAAYFSLEFDAIGNPTGEAVEYADEPTAFSLVNALFDEAVRLNPDLLPKKVASPAASSPTPNESKKSRRASATPNTSARKSPSG
jgi:hypothetical protein